MSKINFKVNYPFKKTQVDVTALTLGHSYQLGYVPHSRSHETVLETQMSCRERNTCLTQLERELCDNSMFKEATTTCIYREVL